MPCLDTARVRRTVPTGRSGPKPGRPFLGKPRPKVGMGRDGRARAGRPNQLKIRCISKIKFRWYLSQSLGREVLNEHTAWPRDHPFTLWSHLLTLGSGAQWVRWCAHLEFPDRNEWKNIIHVIDLTKFLF